MNAGRRRRPSGPTWAIERVLVRSREVRIAFFGAIGRSRASLVTTPTRKGPELHREGEPPGFTQGRLRHSSGMSDE
jgi:hypothetical protein